MWTEAGQAITEVRDDGMGISSDLLPRVFDTFVQAPQSVARSVGGLGIGLALVRSFVTLHGGSVEASSAGARRGSTFTVKLPLLAGTPGAGDARHRADRPKRRRPAPLRVLLVDDNEDALISAAEVLQLVGHEVRTATSGAAALALLPQFQPEVAVLDIGLPDLDGYDLAGRLRAELGPGTLAPDRRHRLRPRQRSRARPEGRLRCPPGQAGGHRHADSQRERLRSPGGRVVRAAGQSSRTRPSRRQRRCSGRCRRRSAPG